MKNLIKHLEESLRIGLNDKPEKEILDFSGCPSNKYEFEAYLNANDYKFTKEKGRYNDDFHVETQYPGVVAHYYFIKDDNYRFEITKNDKELYSTGDIIYSLKRNLSIDSLKLDPLKFFKNKIDEYDNERSSARCGYINYSTGEKEINYHEINHYSEEIEYLEKCLNSLK